MRHVDRGKGPGPASLGKRDKDGLTELDRAINFYSAPPAAVPAGKKQPRNYAFAAYKGADVRQALEDLFHGKCAYCESDYSSTAPVDIEHFRPKGAMDTGQDKPADRDGDSHLGYWWLAMDWLNLLPSCIDCNRRRTQPTPVAELDGLKDALLSQRNRLKRHNILSGKKDAFPLIGAPVQWPNPKRGEVPPSVAGEKRLLLNPTEDDPTKHLVFYVDQDIPLGLVLPAPGDKPGTVSQMGVKSIQIYGLNRMGLVQARTRVMRQLEMLTSLVVDLWATADERASEVRQAKGNPDQDKLVRRLRQMADLVCSEIQKFTEPEAPYSALAQAWLKAFADDLEHKR